MARDGKRDKLVHFLDQRVFDPILRKSVDDFGSETRKRKFQDVKRSTESEKERFHEKYTSAEAVKKNYLSDLSSSAGKKKSAELHDLGMTALPDVRDDFLKLCDKLGV